MHLSQHPTSVILETLHLNLRPIHTELFPAQLPFSSEAVAGTLALTLPSPEVPHWTLLPQDAHHYPRRGPSRVNAALPRREREESPASLQYPSLKRSQIPH